MARAGAPDGASPASPVSFRVTGITFSNHVRDSLVLANRPGPGRRCCPRDYDGDGSSACISVVLTAPTRSTGTSAASGSRTSPQHRRRCGGPLLHRRHLRGLRR
jgi:hypothetical protein